MVCHKRNHFVLWYFPQYKGFNTHSSSSVHSHTSEFFFKYEKEQIEGKIINFDILWSANEFEDYGNEQIYLWVTVYQGLFLRRKQPFACNFCIVTLGGLHLLSHNTALQIGLCLPCQNSLRCTWTEKHSCHLFCLIRFLNQSETDLLPLSWVSDVLLPPPIASINNRSIFWLHKWWRFIKNQLLLFLVTLLSHLWISLSNTVTHFPVDAIFIASLSIWTPALACGTNRSIRPTLVLLFLNCYIYCLMNK